MYKLPPEFGKGFVRDGGTPLEGSPPSLVRWRRGRGLPGPLATRGIPCSHRRDGGIARLTTQGSGLPAWQGRSAGPNFSAMRNWGKNRQRRGLPPPCGIHPAVLGGGCAFLFSALGPVGSHRWRGGSTEGACFCGSLCFYRQGLTRVCRCSQRSGAWQHSS